MTPAHVNDAIADAFAAGDRQRAQEIDAENGSARCRQCGCTEHVACDGGCQWAEPDLCSRCVS